MSKEMVNHPEHYQHGEKECWDEWVDVFGIEGAVIICLGNVHKYLNRAGYKDNNPKEQDIHKAKAYMMKAMDLFLDNEPEDRSQKVKELIDKYYDLLEERE